MISRYWGKTVVYIRTKNIFKKIIKLPSLDGGYENHEVTKNTKEEMKKLYWEKFSNNIYNTENRKRYGIYTPKENISLMTKNGNNKSNSETI